MLGQNDNQIWSYETIIYQNHKISSQNKKYFMIILVIKLWLMYKCERFSNDSLTTNNVWSFKKHIFLVIVLMMNLNICRKKFVANEGFFLIVN